jgi:hypothetical protein
VDDNTAQPDQDDRQRGDDGDFIAWAMGSRADGQKLVIMPLAAGVMAALVATALDIGAGIPVFMDVFPWDLLRGYRCFVLPKQLVFFCMVAAPIASALILLAQPRMRAPLDGNPAPPAITPRQHTITIIGLVAFVAWLSAFHLFGGGWWLACHLESAVGVIARYLLGAFVIACAPAVSIASLVFAYSFRQGLKFRWAPDAARAALRPVGMMIAIIALITLDYAIVARHGIAYKPIVVAMTLMAGGFLVTQGSLLVARFAAWVSALVIAVAVGDVLTAPVRTPLGLLLAKFRAAPIDSVLTLIMVLVWFGFALWVCSALRAKPILDAQKAAGRTRLPVWTGFVCGAALFAFGLGNYLMMEARFGEQARALARQSYGEQYAYQVSGYGYAGYTDHVFVQLEGYNDHELIQAQVEWKE